MLNIFCAGISPYLIKRVTHKERTKKTMSPTSKLKGPILFILAILNDIIPEYKIKQWKINRKKLYM